MAPGAAAGPRIDRPVESPVRVFAAGLLEPRQLPDASHIRQHVRRPPPPSVCGGTRSRSSGLSRRRCALLPGERWWRLRTHQRGYPPTQHPAGHAGERIHAARRGGQHRTSAAERLHGRRLGRGEGGLRTLARPDGPAVRSAEAGVYHLSAAPSERRARAAGTLLGDPGTRLDSLGSARGRPVYYRYSRNCPLTGGRHAGGLPHMTRVTLWSVALLFGALPRLAAQSTASDERWQVALDD